MRFGWEGQRLLFKVGISDEPEDGGCDGEEKVA